MYTRYVEGSPTHGWDEASGMRGLLGSAELPWGASHTFLAMGSYDNPNNRRLWWVDTPSGASPITTSDGGALLGNMIGVNYGDNKGKGIYAALFVRPDGLDAQNQPKYQAGYLAYNLNSDIYPGLGPAPTSGMWSLDGVRYDFYEQSVSGVTPDDLHWESVKLTDIGFVGKMTGDLPVDNFTSWKNSLMDQNWGFWSTTMASGVQTLPSAGWNATAGGNIQWGQSGYWLADLGGDAWTDGKVSGEIAYRYLTPRAMGAFGSGLFGVYEWNAATGLYDWQAASSGVYGGTGNPVNWEKTLTHHSSYSTDMNKVTRRYNGSFFYADGSEYAYYYHASPYFDAPTGVKYLTRLDGETWKKDETFYYADGKAVTTTYEQVCGYYYSCGWNPVGDPQTADWSGPIAVLVDSAPSGYTSSDVNSTPLHASDGSFTGYLGGAESLWKKTDGSPAPVDVLLMGQYVPPAQTNSHTIWNTQFESYNVLDSAYTTYDGGAYRAYFAGIGLPDAAGGQNMAGSVLGLYVDPAGNAGYLRTAQTLSGHSYNGVGMFQMAGKLIHDQVRTFAQTGIEAQDFHEAVAPTDTSYAGSLAGAFGAGGSLTQHNLAFGTMSLVNYEMNRPELWGILNISGYGGFVPPVTPSTTWTGVLGGYANIGVTNAAMYHSAGYSYDGFGGSYDYGYYTDNRTGGLNYRRMTGADAGTGYDRTYYADGTTSTVAYTYRPTGGYYDGPWWEPSDPVSGTWTGSIGSLVSTPPDETSATQISASLQPTSSPDAGYWIVNATDGAWSGATAGATLRGRFLTPTKMGDPDLLPGTGISGDLTGVYNTAGDAWQAASLGTWSGTPLSFSGTANGYLMFYGRHEYDSHTDDYLAVGGYAQGLLGGTATTLFTGAPTDVLLMGSYSNAMGPYVDHESKEPYLMYGSGWYFNGATVSGGSESGNFNGYLVGLWRDGAIKARILSLYATAAGDAGYLKSVGPSGNEQQFFGAADAGAFNLTGSYYPGIGMWEIPGGVLQATSMGTIASTAIVGDYFSGNQGIGNFNVSGGGTLSVLVSAGDPLRFAGANWGIWNAGFGGQYSGTTADDWTIRLGGDYRNNDYSSGYTETGYWLGSIAGQSWDAVEIGGLYAGEALTNLARYTFTGDVIGSHRPIEEGGQWQAAGIGTYTREDFIISGAWNAAGASYSLYGLYTNQGGIGSHAGIQNGLFGLTGEETLYAMGYWQLNRTEEGVSEPGTYLWHAWISGGDVQMEGDMLAKQGFAGGIRQDGASHGNGVLKGYGAAIYKNYSSDAAGILITPLASAQQPFGLTGGYFSTKDADGAFDAQGMWQAEGDFISADMPLPVGDSINDYDFRFGYLTNSRLSGGFHQQTHSAISGVGAGSLLMLAKNDTDVVAPWGIYTMQFYGATGKPNTFSGKPENDAAWSAIAGGETGHGAYGPNSGYWIATVKGDWTDEGILTGNLGAVTGEAGTFGRYLTFTQYGTMAGPFYGVNMSEGLPGTWIGQSLGTYQGQPVAFSSAIHGKKFSLLEYGESSYLDSEPFDGIMAGMDNLWANLGSAAPTSLHMIGDTGFMMEGLDSGPFDLFGARVVSFDPAVSMSPYYSEGGSSKTPVVDGKYGAYSGFIGGVVDRTNKDSISALARALYMDQDRNVGLLYNDSALSGDVYPGAELWQAQGDVYAYRMFDASLVDPSINPINFADKLSSHYDVIGYPKIYASDVTGDAGSAVAMASNISYYTLFDSPGYAKWGLSQTTTGGSYEGNPTSWNIAYPSQLFGIDLDTTFANVNIVRTNDTFSGDTAGAVVSWQDAGTHVMGGQIKGIFDPVASTWKAVALATQMESGAFLDKVSAMSDADRLAFQKATNIPAFQVGQATLGSGGHQTIEGGTMSVTMSNVTFFAPSTGGAASIWASAPNTGGVTGAYTGAPVAGGSTVFLSQQGVGSNVSGLNATFQLNNWNTEAAKWGAAVNGGGIVNSQNIGFTGGAAGTITAGTGSFSGSAAGIVTPPKAAE
jgi:hypothetical protein